MVLCLNEAVRQPTLHSHRIPLPAELYHTEKSRFYAVYDLTITNIILSPVTLIQNCVNYSFINVINQLTTKTTRHKHKRKEKFIPKYII